MNTVYGLIDVKNPLLDIFQIIIQNSEFSSSDENINIQNYLLVTEGNFIIDVHDCSFLRHSVIDGIFNNKDVQSFVSISRCEFE
jgi:hypothetical protein